MLESLITGLELDSAFACTGDMNADGSIQPVGGVEGKLRGAIKRECQIIAVPSQNETVISDAVVNGKLGMLRDIQVFSVGTFDEAVKVATDPSSRDPNLQKAITQFAAIQEVLSRPNGMAYLSNPAVRERLIEIGQLAPNHLSAKYLYLQSTGRAPKTLSISGSLQAIDQAALPLIQAVRLKNFNERQSDLDDDSYSRAIGNLGQIRQTLNQRTWKCADTVVRYANLIRAWVNDRPNSEVKQREQIARIVDAENQLKKEYDDLLNQVDIREELLR